MRALVVYESQVGTTREIAAAVADGLTSRGATTDLVEVGVAPVELPGDLGLLVVGVPTRAFGLPKAPAGAARRAGEGDTGAGIGVRGWVERVRMVRGQPVATFDAKVDRPRLPGSAARAAGRRLRDRGASVLGSATFRVSTTGDEPVPGEVVRARAWAAGLVLDAAMHRVS